MRIALAPVIALLLAVAPAGFAGSKTRETWEPLLSGDILTGWKVYLDPGKEIPDADQVFVLRDGVLTCSGTVNGYIRTEKEYGDYVLKLQWRWTDKVETTRHGGVFVHVSGPDRLYPKALAAQLMIDRAGDLWLLGGFNIKGRLAQQDPGNERRFLRSGDPKEREIGSWNDMSIACRGATVRVSVNGVEVNQATHAESTRGGIALQAAGAELQFRNVLLKSLAK